MRTRRFRGFVLTLTVAALAVGLVPAFSASAVGTGNEGCTPGYWKNHLSSWQEYNPATATVGGAFQLGSATIPQKGDKLTAALAYNGGSGIDGARRILLRAATAALLNAAHDGLGYPLTRFAPDNLVARVRNLLLTGTREQMLSFASELDRLNNLGCPLN